MTWLRLDDDMLDHPKWVRAIRDGGSASLHLWLALCSWCSRHLTDGEIPADMVEAIRGPNGAKVTAKARQALADASLIVQRDDGGVTVVDYLQRNPSRAEVTERARRKQQSQQDYVDRRRRTSLRPVALIDDRELSEKPPIPSRPDPVPIPKEGEQERTPTFGSSCPETPRPAVAYVGLQPSKRDQAAGSIPLGPRRFDPAWKPGEEHRVRGHELGLTDEQILEEAEDCCRKHYPHGFLTEDDQFFRELKWLAVEHEKSRFKNLPKSQRDDFETPGHRRRA